MKTSERACAVLALRAEGMHHRRAPPDCPETLARERANELIRAWDGGSRSIGDHLGSLLGTGRYQARTTSRSTEATQHRVREDEPASRGEVQAKQDPADPVERHPGQRQRFEDRGVRWGR